jgi:hypothetical protein
MEIQITLLVDDGDPSADPGHTTGLTEDAYKRLSGYTEAHGAGSLSWLGEIQNVEKVTAED